MDLTTQTVELTMCEKIMVGALVGALIGLVSVVATHYLHTHITESKTQ